MNRLGATLKKYLIPHEGNDHRPHILRPQAIVFVCLIAIVIEATFLFGSSYVIPRSRLFGTILVNALVDGTNEARLSSTLPALKENALLDLAAQQKANDMVRNGYFAHTSPSGVTPWFWFENVGYNFIAAGENLAVDFTDSADVTTAWLNSPEHRANIMQAGYTEIGMATAEGQFQGHDTIFVVELFGTPVPSFAFAPSAASVPTASAATKLAAPTTPKPAPKPVAVNKPASVMPVIVTPATGTETTSQPIAVTVKGAETGFANAPAPANTTTATPAAPVESSTATAPAPASSFAPNFVQSAAVDPRRTVDYVYLVIAIFFAFALLLNIFIKVHIQHPQVILGGMLVILVAGLLIVLNQHGAGAVIL